jgi:hypothetical protein
MSLEKKQARRSDEKYVGELVQKNEKSQVSLRQPAGKPGPPPPVKTFLRRALLRGYDVEKGSRIKEGNNCSHMRRCRGEREEARMMGLPC